MLYVHGSVQEHVYSYMFIQAVQEQPLGWKVGDILHQQCYTAVFVKGEMKPSKLNCCKI